MYEISSCNSRANILVFDCNNNTKRSLLFKHLLQVTSNNNPAVILEAYVVVFDCK